jgi:hypothetical protein
MGYDNHSPRHNLEREWARRWLLKTKDGSMAVDHLKASFGNRISNELNDGNWVQWEDLVSEYKDCSMIAASNAEARAAFDIASHASTSMGAPVGSASKMLRFFSPPSGYVFRRIAESGDPMYWNDKVNVLREALREENALWLCVPRWIVSAHLESMLPKGTRASTVDQSPNMLVDPESTTGIIPVTESFQSAE